MVTSNELKEHLAGVKVMVNVFPDNKFYNDMEALLTTLSNVTADEPDRIESRALLAANGIPVVNAEYADWHKAKHMQQALRIAELERLVDLGNPYHNLLELECMGQERDEARKENEQLRQQLDAANASIAELENLYSKPRGSFKNTPSECKHESAVFMCNECGINFRNAKPDQPPQPPFDRNELEALRIFMDWHLDESSTITLEEFREAYKILVGDVT